MKRFLTAYYLKWYVPVLTAGLLGFICLFTLPVGNIFVFYASLGIPSLALALSGFLGLARLFRKQYLHGALQISSTLLVAWCGLFIIGSQLMFYPYDFYASFLQMPKDIELHIPKDTIRGDCGDGALFELYNGGQPGIYSYDACLKSPVDGTIYLKAFEVTKNEPLSSRRLALRSEIPIYKDKDAIYCLNEDFTIYEGDWGDAYAARFELWFRPAGDTTESKIAEKVYKIEGWQR